MSRIDEMLHRLCIDSVEHHPLGEMCDFNRGRWIKAEALSPGLVPVVTSAQAVTEYHSESNREDETVVIASSGAYAGFVSYWSKPIYLSNAFSVDPKRGQLIPRFLYFVLKNVQGRLHLMAHSAGVPNIYGRDMAHLMIPVPPLELQREIVGMLDTFTELEAELEAELVTELEARRRQYEHYRDTLLNPDRDEREWLTLRDVAVEFGRGKSKHRPRNDPQLYGGRYPFIQTGDIRNSRHMITAFSQTYNEEGLAQSKLWPHGTVCITIAANIAETGILNFPACFPDSVIGLVVDPEKASRYFVEYLLQSFKGVLAAEGRGTAQANINVATFENERFPFPPLKEQARIVSILDNFDALLTDLNVGIADELAGRRRQYEYYRDRLLTFEEIS